MMHSARNDEKSWGFRFTRWFIRRVIDTTLRLEVHGIENLPPGGSYLIVSNHLGRLDPVLVHYFLDRNDVVLLVAEKYARVPALRWFVHQINSLFIDRFKPDIKTVREALARLKAGDILVLAPEGTRSKTEALQEGRPGASYLAVKANAPILPAAITGTEDRAVKANLWRLRKSAVTIRLGKPFTLPPLSSHDRDAELQAATDEIMCRIAVLLPPAYRGVYAHHPRTQELLAQTDQAC